ncbi:MAG: retroviral-like aspartic protease family protein [Alphaproteobacteria bacterium]
MTISRRSLAQMLAAAGAVAPIAQARAQEQDDPAPNEPVTRAPTTRDKATRLVAPVTINGQGPFDFLVDTGANRSCISKDLAEALSLPAGPEISIRTMVGSHPHPTARVDRLEIAGKSQRRINIPVLPMPMQDSRGVLGVDWLKSRRLVLDFKGKSLEISPPKHEVSTPNRVVVPARRRSGQLTMVDADMSGTPISAMIDSGSQVSIGNAALRHLLSRADAGRIQVEKVELTSLVGEKFPGEMGYLPFLRLGGLTLGNVPVVFAEASVFELWDLSSKPAIILGIDLLAQFNAVALDFGRSTVRFDIV